MDRLQPFRVAPSVLRGNGPTGKEVVDLSYTVPRDASRSKRIEECLGWCRDRIVPAVRGALPGALLPRERTRDDSRRVVWRNEHRASGLAAAVQFLERNHRLVGGDLEDRIGRRVHDPRARPHMLRAEPVEDLRAAACNVADDRAPRSARELVDHVLRKPVGIGRERSLEVNARDFPVAGRAVLSGRARGERSPRGPRQGIGRHAGNGDDVTEPGTLEIRERETGDCSGDVGERVAPGIPVCSGIGGRAGPHTVEHQNHCTPPHAASPVYTRGRRVRRPVNSSYGESSPVFATSQMRRPSPPPPPITVATSPMSQRTSVTSIIVMSIVTTPTTGTFRPPTRAAPRLPSALRYPSA